MAKIELGIVWMLSLITIVTQSDVIFVFSLMASSTIILRNLPGAIKVIRSITNKITK